MVRVEFGRGAVVDRSWLPNGLSVGSETHAAQATVWPGNWVLKLSSAAAVELGRRDLDVCKYCLAQAGKKSISEMVVSLYCLLNRFEILF